MSEQSVAEKVDELIDAMNRNTAISVRQTEALEQMSGHLIKYIEELQKTQLLYMKILSGRG